MPIQDVHLLIAQARVEADNPAFKVMRHIASPDDFAEYSFRRICPSTSVSVESPAPDDEAASEGRTGRVSSVALSLTFQVHALNFQRKFNGELSRHSMSPSD
jgi:hypothetical protein